MKKLITLLIVSQLMCFFSFGQFAVTTNSGSGLLAGYTSLAAAITALNGATITSPVIITCAAGTETSPAGGYSITATGTVANTITIVGAGGAGSIITAPTTHTSGLINDAIVKIIGGDYVTIEGFGMYENASNVITTSASNNMTEFGVALFYATVTNGAQNCNVKNNVIDLNKNYQNSFGIYSNTNHNAASVSALAPASSTAGNNNGLTIIGNTITDVNRGIAVLGSSTAGLDMDGLIIGGSAANKNTISDYGLTGNTSSYVSVSGTIFGVFLRYAKNVEVSYNEITSATSGQATITIRGIYHQSSITLTLTGTITNSFNNNSFAIRSSFVSATIQGIAVDSFATNNTTTLNINNNDFNNFGHSVAGTGSITCIGYFGKLGVAHALVNNINNNSFTNITVNTTASFTFISASVTLPAGGSQTVSNNRIVGSFSKTGVGSTIALFNNIASSPNGTTSINSNNNFSNITVTGLTAIGGWINRDGASTTNGPTKTITNNVFKNWTGGKLPITALTENAGSAGSIISGNTISKLTGDSLVNGVTLLSNTNATFTGNTIDSLTLNGAGTLNGLLLFGTTTATNTLSILKNKIHFFNANNALDTINGIAAKFSTAGTSAIVLIANNTIGNFYMPTGNGAIDIIRGINISTNVTNTSYKLYHNTILLNASSSGANFSTSGIFHNLSSTAINSNLDMRNNIIINKSTPNGTGIAVAFRRSASTDLNNYNTTSNNNIFYAGIPSANKLIFYDGTNANQTLTAFQASVTPRETNSKTEDVPFESTIGSNANFLRIALGAVTVAESAAVVTTTPATTDDYWSIARPFASPVNGGTTNDIGASEFDGFFCSPGKWVGGTSTAWNLPSNWCDGIVPISSTNVTIPSGAPFQPTISVASPAATTNNITLNAGATLTMATGGLYQISGNITNSGTLNTAAGDISFLGTTLQTPPALNIKNLIINNAAGVTLTGDINVSGALTLANGIVTTTAANILNVENDATSTLAIAASFVNGPMKKTGDDNFIFPIGKAGTSIRIGECAINNTLGTGTDVFSAEYFPTPYSSLAVFGTLTAIDSAEYWDINRTSGVSTPDITLYWKDGIFSGIPGTISSANITVGHFDGSLWQDESYGSHTGDRVMGGSVTTSAVNNFSPFTIGLTAGVLPLGVNSFTATKQNSNTNAINWKATCTGASVSFELQRSNNGINFIPLTNVTATQARCAAPFNYVDNYNATSPITYYKLKVISNTGEVKYSQIVAINNKNANANTMALYPNIVKGNAVLVVESKTTTNANFVITDAKGAIVCRFTESLSEGANAYPINVSSLSVGSYQITGIIDGALKTIRFIKE